MVAAKFNCFTFKIERNNQFIIDIKIFKFTENELISFVRLSIFVN